MKLQIALSPEDVISACRQFIEERFLLNERRNLWDIECTNDYALSRPLEFSLKPTAELAAKPAAAPATYPATDRVTYPVPDREA